MNKIFKANDSKNAPQNMAIWEAYRDLREDPDSLYWDKTMELDVMKFRCKSICRLICNPLNAGWVKHAPDTFKKQVHPTQFAKKRTSEISRREIKFTEKLFGSPYPTVGKIKLMQNHINNHLQEGNVSIRVIGLIVVILVASLIDRNQSDRKPVQPDSQLHLLMNDWPFKPNAQQPW